MARAASETNEVRDELKREHEKGQVGAQQEELLTETLRLLRETLLRVVEREKTAIEKRDGLQAEMAGVPKKIDKAVKDAVEQRDREWRPFLKEEVDKATRDEKKRGAAALQGAKQRAATAKDATGIAEGVMEEMRGERGPGPDGLEERGRPSGTTRGTRLSRMSRRGRPSGTTRGRSGTRLSRMSRR